MSKFERFKHRLYFGVATGVLSLCLTGMLSSEGHAQRAEPQVLPPVSIDSPQQRVRPARTVRTRTAPQRVARTAPRPPAERPAPSAPPTMNTTRTIGAPPPAYAGGQVAQGGSLGLLGNQSLMNVPFSTVNFTTQLMQDQQARTIADTLINDSSVRQTTAANGFAEDFQIRGFPVAAGDVAWNGLYGIISDRRIPVQAIERIEVVKGPGALINGISPGGNIGGTINVTSKRAPDEAFNRITPFFMTGANYGIHLESSRRFGENKEWGIRFNGVGRNGEASIDNGNWRQGLGALSIDYRGERLRWTVDAISQNDDYLNYRPQINIRTTVPFLPGPPDARSTWYPGAQLKQRDNIIASGLEFDFTDAITGYAGIGYREGNTKQDFPDSRPGAPFPGGADQFGNIQVINGYFDSYTKTVSGNVGVRARFQTGFIGHSVNVAFTGMNQEAGNSFGSTAPISVASNIYNPSPLPAFTGVRTDPRRASDTTFTSVALADTMSFFDDLVLVTGGVRHQMVKTLAFSTATGVQTSAYDAEATSPLGGIVIKPLRNISLYANYAEGLSQGTIVPAGFANAGAVLAPFKSKQQEAGVKVDWGSITTSFAIFQIMRPSLITTAANVRAYDGEQRNRGIELSAFGLLAPGLRGLASVTFLRPELTSPTNPAERGNFAAGTPDATFSAGLDYDLPWVRGLSVNGRVIYTSGSYLTTANLGWQRFPSWERFDIGARYAFISPYNGKPIVVRAGIENLFDKQYWITSGGFQTVGSPRTYLLSAAFDF